MLALNLIAAVVMARILQAVRHDDKSRMLRHILRSSVLMDMHNMVDGKDTARVIIVGDSSKTKN